MGRPPKKIDRSKIDSATVWKLVEAKSKQLSDVISATRVPFLVALSWALLWSWALYTTDQGYLKTYRARYIAIAALMESTTQTNTDLFKDVCKNYIFPIEGLPTVSGHKVEPDKDWGLDYCKRLVKRRNEFSEKTFLEQRLISFPGGFAKVHISDLGVVGNIAFILILSWTFYAIRRENGAVESFVKSNADKKNDGRFPKKFTLVPQGDLFTPAHLSYVYQVVSQRFLFILATNSRPLLFSTIALCCFPAVVSVLHFYTDIRDVANNAFEWSVYLRVLIEMALLGIVCLLTAKIVEYIIDTSVLLNGWNLAVRDVWLKEWNESLDEAAAPVIVDVSVQKAFQE
jgi:hypothetical protein